MKLFLVSGFLGSGKTTAIQQACLELSAVNLKAAVITNDQGIQLVDSAFIRHYDIPLKEVVDGCFCCNYNELEKHIQAFQSDNKPDIIFAESVGSCTDIIATVAKPLMRYHPDLEIVISVFADALVLLKRYETGKLGFDKNVAYIYQKQLEEADLLIINKIDLLNEQQLDYLKAKLQVQYPDKLLLFQNSLEHKAIQNWLLFLNNFRAQKDRNSLDIDYNIYGEGEAQLAWLDDEIEIHTSDNRSAELAVDLINSLFDKLNRQSYPIGHLKFLIDDGKTLKKISFTSSDTKGWETSEALPEAANVILLINARVQASPAQMKVIINEAIQEISQNTVCKISRRKLAAFQPGFPRPTHRILT